MADYTIVGNLKYAPYGEETEKTVECCGFRLLQDEELPQIAEVNIPEIIQIDNITYSVVSIGPGAFNSEHYGEYIKVVSIGKNVKIIQGGAFKECVSLESVSFDKGNELQTIDSEAFFRCDKLSSINLSDSITEIGNSAFSGCTNLTNFKLPPNLETLGSSAFSGCANVFTSITIPNKITILPHSVFSQCTGLTEVIFPEVLEKIDTWAFSGCNKLTRIVVPKSVYYIGYGAFAGCTSLESIELHFIGEQPYSSAMNFTLFGYIFGSDEYDNAYKAFQIYSPEEARIGYYLPNSLTTVIINGSFENTHVHYGAFSGCKNLKQITIPSIEHINDYTFENCEALELITTPEGTFEAKTIGDYAFYNCKSITKPPLSSNIEKIGKYAFCKCKSLTSFVLPEAIIKIEEGTFSETEGLQEVILNAKEIEIDRDAFKQAKNLTEITLPATKFIDSQTNQVNHSGYQFDGCTSLKKVIFKDKSYVQSQTFNNCTNLIIEFKKGEELGAMSQNYPYGAQKDSLTIKSANKLLTTDMDFLGFTFNGLHSHLDLKALRVSEGARYNLSLSPTINDLTAENPSADGIYYFGSWHKGKKFNINVAFERLTDIELRKWRQFCSNKELGDLIFDEEPYKVYRAKITGQPSLKVVPFDEGEARIYRGEGNIEFTCYWPYAHTPDYETKMSPKMLIDGRFGMNGKILTSYGMFRNKDHWAFASGLINYNETCQGENPGDLPAPFVLTKEGITNKNTFFRVGALNIKVLEDINNLQWDSKTGIVSGTVTPDRDSKRVVIAIEGESIGGIPIGGLSEEQLVLNGSELNYHYWYY